MTNVKPANRIVRKLSEAEGYLELDLPVLALESLQQIESPGPLAVPCLFLTGETLKRLERYDEAIAPLRHVASCLPAPLNVIAWRSVAECLKKSGRDASGRQCSDTADILARSVSELSVTQDQHSTHASLPKFGGVTLTAGKNNSVTISIDLPKGGSSKFDR